MKKILGILLVMCMLIPMLGAFNEGAYAAKDYSAYVDTVEISKGDTVYSIVSGRGMEYSDVLQAVLIVNGFSNEKSLSAVKPGQEILIPKSAEAAEAIISLYNAIATAVIPASYVTEYKVCSGDSMSSICNSLNLTYGTCKYAIMSLNGWTDEVKLAKIYVGEEIRFPVSDDAAVVINSTISEAKEDNMHIAANSSDEFEYFLVKHQMAKGETIKSVCKAYGIDYTASLGEKIKALNGLSDISKVQAGVSYLFPSESSTGAVYAVYSHKIVSGDTMNDLCSAYSVKYNDVADMLAALNPKINLSAIKTGRTISLLAAVDAVETPVVFK